MHIHIKIDLEANAIQATAQAPLAKANQLASDFDKVSVGKFDCASSFPSAAGVLGSTGPEV